MEPALYFPGSSLHPVLYTSAVCVLELMESLNRPWVPAKVSGSWGITWSRTVYSLIWCPYWYFVCTNRKTICMYREGHGSGAGPGPCFYTIQIKLCKVNNELTLHPNYSTIEVLCSVIIVCHLLVAYLYKL